MFVVFSLTHCTYPPATQSHYSCYPISRKYHHTNNILLDFFTVGISTFPSSAHSAVVDLTGTGVLRVAVWTEMNGSVEERQVARPFVSVPKWIGTLGTTEELMSAQANLWKYVQCLPLRICRLSFERPLYTWKDFVIHLPSVAVESTQAQIVRHQP